MAKSIKDDALYREMNQPFADSESADKATEAFFDEVRELRKKHQIADVVTVAQVSFVDNGQEVHVISRSHSGNSLMEVPMLAHAYGAAKSAWDRLMEKLVGVVSR